MFTAITSNRNGRDVIVLGEVEEGEATVAALLPLVDGELGHGVAVLAQAQPRLDLHEDDAVVALGDDVDLSPAAAPVALEDAIASLLEIARGEPFPLEPDLARGVLAHRLRLEVVAMVVVALLALGLQNVLRGPLLGLPPLAVASALGLPKCLDDVFRILLEHAFFHAASSGWCGTRGCPAVPTESDARFTYTRWNQTDSASPREEAR
jgi:hypothetical protein